VLVELGLLDQGHTLEVLNGAPGSAQPMEVWQMAMVCGVWLADGSEASDR
jgi:hypothetical protein